MASQVVGRFAPSPTGRMHAGNIFAALVQWLIVRKLGGRIVLRIEDLDIARSRSSFADQVQRDFEALGLTWDEGPYYQQGREEAYRAAYAAIERECNVYPCFCTRADLHALSAPHRGEKLVYPGTCRNLTEGERALRSLEREPSYRVEVPARTYALDDMVQGRYEQDLALECGDFVLRRSDGLFAYQLAVVVDDAEQGVNCIARGMDLLCSTPQQMFLQDVLGYGHPRYAHVPLLVSQRDRRLSKRDHDASLDEMLARFGSTEGIIGHIAGLTGLAPDCTPASPDELLDSFDPACLTAIFPDKIQILWQ